MTLTLNLKEQCPDERSHTSLVPVPRWRPVVVSAIKVPGASGTPWGAVGDEMVGADPRLGGGTGNLL
jgi:hypothetical protein